MRNLPCLGGVSGGVGVGGTGKSAAVDTTTAEAPTTPTTSSYFATTYYHINDDECTFLKTHK